MSSILDLWNEYTVWLKQNLPQYAIYLNKPADELDFKMLQKEIDLELPNDLKQIYLINNGDHTNKIKQQVHMGCFLGFEFLSIERIIEEFKSWDDIRKMDWSDFYGSSTPKGAIKINYVNSKWLPILKDGASNYIGIDYDPDLKGKIGQVINFGRDEDHKFVIANSFTEFMKIIINEKKVGSLNKAIILEEEGEYSFGLRPGSHLIDDLREIMNMDE